MIGNCLMLAGMAMMMPWPRGRRADVNPIPGQILREAYGGALAEPIPHDMRHLTKRIAGGLKVVGGTAS